MSAIAIDANREHLLSPNDQETLVGGSWQNLTIILLATTFRADTNDNALSNRTPGSYQRIDSHAQSLTELDSFRNGFGGHRWHPNRLQERLENARV